MQPTYLPWSGYLGLLDIVDTFVFLDDVQFDKRSWQQRNKILTTNGDSWITVPVLSKGLRDQKIKDVRMDHEQDFRKKHIAKISHSYSKSPYYRSFSSKLFLAISQQTEFLADFNIALIDLICSELGFTTTLMRSSELASEGKREHQLINICKILNSDHYVSVQGSKAYLEETTAFSDNGIELSYFEYDHPIYPQLSDSFWPNMSIIDMIFNCSNQSAANQIREASRII